MKCRGCQQDNPSHANFCLKCGAPLKGTDPTAKRYTDLKDEVDGLRRSLTEALEQQTATAEILRVISSSATDIQPVFDAIVRSAARLCNAYFGIATRYDGELARLVAHHNMTPEAVAALHRVFTHPPTTETATGRVLLSGTIDHTVDLATDVASPAGAQIAIVGGFRTNLVVPMLRGERVIGSISVARREAQSFSEAEIALLKTCADQAVIAIENVRLFTELQEKNRALSEAHAQVSEALEQQTATAEILSVISSSPTDVQPVFDTIVKSAARLCDATVSGLARFDGNMLEIGATYGYEPSALDYLRRAHPRRPARDSGWGRAVLERRVIHIHDVTVDPEYQHSAIGYRTLLAVPLMREQTALGAIAIWRRDVKPFSEQQIALLETFADQAVIAIENVRLFNETKEALEQQTATSEILRVIASSPGDVAPVFEVILRSAVELSDSVFGVALRYDGELLHLMAHYNQGPEGLAVLQRTYPAPLSIGTPSAQAIARREPVLVEDAAEEAIGQASRVAIARAVGNRSTMSVPMLRDGQPIGAITLGRAQPGSYSTKHLALLQTFADQAVIAIENVRLFTALQTSNRELTTALDKQTATSDILRVISSSQTDVQPVFDTILTSAFSLLGAHSGYLTRIAGDQIEIAALRAPDDATDAAMRASFPRLLQSTSASAQAIRERTPINIGDFETDPRVSEVGRTIGRLHGYKSWIIVPMLRHDEGVGTIVMVRRTPGGFAPDEITLLQTFADQAVIAIENARLLTELHARTAELTQSVSELRALGEVGQAISSTLDLRTVLNTIVARATELSGTDAGVVYEYDEQREVFLPRATQHLEAEIVETMLATPVRKGEGATGRLAEVQEPIQLPDILQAPAESRVRGALLRAGYRALLAVPLVREDDLIGGLTVIRKATGEFAPEVIDLMRTFATQSALAIQNARLFLEIEDKSRQLEAASQHKSEFLANMSHELRTPLNAILGFSEVLSERMFGELNEKQAEYVQDIHASGTHLLSLINDILDLSKVEAGRMELDLGDFDFPNVVDTAALLTRERASRRGIVLQVEMDERLGTIHGDERKIKQVLLNLLSNAIKFTPEGGRIDLRALPGDGAVEVSVSDTGVGIAPEDQEAIFEEFRQVGMAAKKVEGTGLGLALSRKLIELHGGRIWVTSQVGAGSTFTFTIPVLRKEMG